MVRFIKQVPNANNMITSPPQMKMLSLYALLNSKWRSVFFFGGTVGVPRENNRHLTGKLTVLSVKIGDISTATCWVRTQNISFLRQGIK